MRNDKYVRIIHRRKVLRELQAIIHDKWMLTDQVTKAALLCEEAPYLDREVSQEALLEVSGWIELLEREETKKLGKFELVEKEELELPEAVKEAVSPKKEKHVVKEKKRKARPKPAAETTPQPGVEDQSTGETPPES